MTWKVWLGTALVVAASSVVVFRSRIEGHKEHVRYQTTKVDRGPMSAKVTATGTLSALVTVQIGSQVSGRIQDILVDFNDSVKKGQVLARIDSQLLQATAAQARANLAAARGALAKAQANAENTARRLERARTLAEKKLVAEADLDQASADAASARADVEAANGNIAQAVAATRQTEINLTYATIVSPVQGVVISRTIDVGQTVAASFQAPTLFTIAGDLTKMQVDTSVAEADVGKLATGIDASFTVDAYAGRTFKGRVREVRNAPQIIQNVVTYDAVIDVDNSDLLLKPGMTAHVTFVYAERVQALRVPNAAFRFRAQPADDAKTDAGERVVWQLKAGKPEPVGVKTGVSGGGFSELLGGPLHEGSQVVVDEEGDLAPASPATGSKRASRLF